MPEKTFATRIFYKLLADTKQEVVPGQRDVHQLKTLTQQWETFMNVFNVLGNKEEVLQELLATDDNQTKQKLLYFLRESITMAEHYRSVNQLRSLHDELIALSEFFPEEKQLVDWIQTAIIFNILHNSIDPQQFIDFITDWQSQTATHNLGRFIHDINKHLLIASLRVTNPTQLLDQAFAYFKVDGFDSVPTDQDITDIDTEEITIAQLKGLFADQLPIRTGKLNLRFEVSTSGNTISLSRENLTLLNTFAYNLSLNSTEAYQAAGKDSSNDGLEIVVSIIETAGEIMIGWRDFAGGFPATDQETFEFTSLNIPILTFVPDAKRINRGLNNLNHLAENLGATLTMGTTFKIIDTYTPVEGQFDEYGDPLVIREQHEKRTGSLTLISWKKSS